MKRIKSKKNEQNLVSGLDNLGVDDELMHYDDGHDSDQSHLVQYESGKMNFDNDLNLPDFNMII